MDRAVAEFEISGQRISELKRWHGTDENDLPAANTLQNLSRDTIAALNELQQSRERIAELRAAMGRAFWAQDARELHAIVLDALGPPPEPDDLDLSTDGPTNGSASDPRLGY
jgi:hypothetical protein